jgi:hypothetical protein
VKRSDPKYANRRGKPAGSRGRAYQPDLPDPGCYLIRLARGGPPVALRIWFGAPLDPDTGEELDRAPRWMAQINGTSLIEFDRVWPECAKRPISDAEHDRIAKASLTVDRSDPFYDPKRPVDYMKTPMPF